jgi:hypothetical protein
MVKSMSLREFREGLQGLMTEPGLRPFICSGSPLACSVFIVGFNPATPIDEPFWNYWNDEIGFDKKSFMQDYLRKRGLAKPKGVRARIERIVCELSEGTCLETNICSRPTETAAELAPGDRTTDIFQFLLRTVKPRLVYAHSNQPIDYFIRLTGCRDFDKGEARQADVDGHKFLITGTRGPLFRMGFEDASSLGRSLRDWLQRSGTPPSDNSSNPMAR